MFATMKAYFKIVQMLLKKGADPNIKSNGGSCPVIEAVKLGRKDIFDLLVSYKADLKVRDMSNKTLLILSAEKGNHKIASVLLQNGADLNAVAFGGYTVLMAGAVGGSLEIVQELFKNNPKLDVDKRNYNKETALILAVKNNNFKVAKLLWTKGARLNFCDEGGWNALMHAAGRGNFAMVNMLLQPRPIKEEHKQGLKGMYSEVYKNMIEKEKINKNEANDYGKTALMLAAEEGYYDVVQLLLKNKASCALKDKDGYTAFTHAVKNSHFEVAELLEKHGGKPSLWSMDGLKNIKLISKFAFKGWFAKRTPVKKEVTKEQVKEQEDVMRVLVARSQKDIEKNLDLHGGEMAKREVREREDQRIVFIPKEEPKKEKRLRLKKRTLKKITSSRTKLHDGFLENYLKILDCNSPIIGFLSI